MGLGGTILEFPLLQVFSLLDAFLEELAKVLEGVVG